MSFTHADPEQVRSLLASGDEWVFLDVRTPEEFRAGHVPGAVNAAVALPGPSGMQLNPGFVEEVLGLVGPEQPLVVGCAAGGRSAAACELLASRGFQRLVNMTGGFSGGQGPAGHEPGWAARGFPVERPGE